MENVLVVSRIKICDYDYSLAPVPNNVQGEITLEAVNQTLV
jgi:hypothetical protein